MVKEVRAHNLARRENARFTLPPLPPTSTWLGGEVYGAIPINISVRQISLQSLRDGIYVLEIFGGIGLGVLRSALKARYVIRCYTYVDRNAIRPRIAREMLR